jgi:phosphonate transport system substrate-binding protein
MASRLTLSTGFRALARRLAVLAAVAAGLGCAALPAVAAAPLHVGLIGVLAPDEIRAQWRPLLAALSQRLGVAVEADVSKDYADVVWAMREGRDMVAWLGPKSAVEAVDNAGGEVFARMVYDDGVAGYYSLLIARSALPLKTVDEVFARAGELTLGSGDANSTSGTLVPAYYLFARNGVNPRKDFRRVVQSNHEGNIQAVADGRVDVATVASMRFERIAREHPEVAAAVRVIWRSPQIPSDPLVWRRDLPADTKRQIRAFFLEYGMPGPHKDPAQLAEERGVLARLSLSHFIASNDRQLLPVRQVELFRRRLAAEDDSGLAADERRRRLDEIDQSLAALDRTVAAPGN